MLYIEIISQLETQFHILYTGFKTYNLSSKESHNIYSLLHYPKIKSKNIYEYMTDDLTSDEIINSIITKISKHKEKNYD